MKYSEEKTTLIKHLMMLHFQIKVICFKLTNILLFDKKKMQSNKQNAKIKTSEKCKY